MAKPELTELREGDNMAKKTKEKELEPGTGRQQEEENIRTTPDVEADFSSLLKDYGLKENKAS